MGRYRRAAVRRLCIIAAGIVSLLVGGGVCARQADAGQFTLTVSVITQPTTFAGGVIGGVWRFDLYNATAPDQPRQEHDETGPSTTYSVDPGTYRVELQRYSTVWQPIGTRLVRTLTVTPAGGIAGAVPQSLTVAVTSP